MGKSNELVSMKDVKRVLFLLSIAVLAVIWINALTLGNYHTWIIAVLTTPIFGLLGWEVYKRGKKRSR